MRLVGQSQGGQQQESSGRRDQQAAFRPREKRRRGPISSGPRVPRPASPLLPGPRRLLSFVTGSTQVAISSIYSPTPPLPTRKMATTGRGERRPARLAKRLFRRRMGLSAPSRTAPVSNPFDDEEGARTMAYPIFKTPGGNPSAPPHGFDPFEFFRVDAGPIHPAAKRIINRDTVPQNQRAAGAARAQTA